MFTSCNRKAGLPDLRETYGHTEPKPFGGKVAYEIFTHSYDAKFINLNDRPFGEFRRNTYSDEKSLYISISQKALFEEEDASSLLGFVEEGHTVFLSASYIDTV